MFEKKVVLFDFDGVIMDTETIYTDFWNVQGERYLGVEGFGEMVKGNTDHVIYEKYFSDRTGLKPILDKAIADLEHDMPMNYIRGTKEFISSLRMQGMRIGMATSSDMKKMDMVFRKRPELKGLLDKYVTVNDVVHPKPNPEGYLKLIKAFGVDANDAIVFEDSIIGLTAARASGAIVVGVASTNPRSVIAPYCDYIIDNFEGLTDQKVLEFYKR